MNYRILVLAVFIVAFSYAGYMFFSGNLELKAVLSGSMYPAIHPGDAVVILKTSPDVLKEGDIVTFKTGKTFTTHRIVEVRDGAFITKGDANEDIDASPVSENAIDGKVIFLLPYFGYLGGFVRTVPGFILFILGPAMLIMYSEVKKILNEAKKPERHLYHYKD